MKLHVVIFLNLLSVAFGFNYAAFRKQIVFQHKKLRNGEPATNMQPIKWNAKLAKFGQEWANKCYFGHGEPPDAKDLGEIGQNIYASWGHRLDIIGRATVNYWFSEKKNYHFESNTCTPGKECEHYTQIVWAETTDVGCGYQHCPGGMDIVVCNYLPAGNYEGEHPYKKREEYNWDTWA